MFSHIAGQFFVIFGMNRLIISLLFLLSNVVFSQELNIDAVWTETFGNATGDEGNAVQQTTDGGFIIVGLTRPYEGDNMPRLWLIKTDSIGTEEWTYFYDESGSSVGYSFQQTTDGGYIAVGTHSNNALLVKVNSQGTEEWSQTRNGT